MRILRWLATLALPGVMALQPAATFSADATSSLPAAPIASSAWRSTLEKDHPLSGRIWSPPDEQFVDPAALISRLQTAPFVLLGEKHDNEDHHRLQAWIVETLLANGRRRALALEMFDTDQSERLGGYLSDHPKDAGGIGSAVGWDKTGWPDWSIYAPIVQAALDAEAPVLPANLSKSMIKSIARSGVEALGADAVSALRLREPLPEADRARMRQEIVESHCNMLPESMIEPMMTVLKARDAQMASVLVAGASAQAPDGGILVAGGGHVRNDHGVPWHLRRLAPGRKILSLAFLEVRAGEFDPSAYAQMFNRDYLPFDFVWFTPRVDDADPCAEHAEELRRLKTENPAAGP